MQFHILTHEDPLWESVRSCAAACSWSAGKHLAAAMTNGDFTEWERVIAAAEGDRICGFCTVAARDCIPDVPYTPYIGYVFVDEAARGHRLSQRLIDCAAAYLASVGFERVYLVSDHENLYEKYGFAVIDRKIAPWGAEEKIYMKTIPGGRSNE